jgi:predicted RNA binding protein YcfA (HicA-like mRNA interferase family)
MAYPEHEKLAAISDKSQEIGEFLDWLQKQGWHLARYHGHHLRTVHKPITSLLASYFEIDEGVLESEKRQMLDALRSAS